MNPCPTTPRPTPHGVPRAGGGRSSGSLSPLSSRRGTKDSGRSNAYASTVMFRYVPYGIVLFGIANYMIYILHRVANNGDIIQLADSYAFGEPATSSHYPYAEVPRRIEGEPFPNKEFKPYDRALILSVNQRHAARNFNTCSFRTYPEHRYYGVENPLDAQPSFLKDAKYIRGEKPVILNPLEKEKSGEMTKPTKVCIDTSEWEDFPSKNGIIVDRFPFSDGQNPSIVSLSTKQKAEGMASRFFASTVLTPLCDVYGAAEVDNMFIGVLVVGNAQCRWKMGPDDMKRYHFSDLEEAPDRRTIVTVFDKDMETLDQMTLMLELDAPWGTQKKNKGTAKKDKDGNYERAREYFDDPRFFFHKGHLMMLYRHGPRFGYENQVQNPVYLEKTEDEFGRTSLHAYIKASETFVVCCGRNIAFISANGDSSQDPPSLKALTWVDPVTVVDVEPKPSKKAEKNNHKERSNIHGTNGWMLPLHSTNEYLGIAHFHRPEDRKKSEYALHGHHYTHAFFTIAREGNGGEFKLKRLSNEFLFRAILETDPPKVDAETIQFSSGLDINGSDVDGKLLISYGINDCEGGTFFVDMKVVQKMLLDVPEGDEVNDLMAQISTR